MQLVHRVPSAPSIPAAATAVKCVPLVSKRFKLNYKIGFSCGSTGMTTPSGCPDGYYSGMGATTCTACPAGYHCPNAYTIPVICPGGSYSTSTSDGVYQTCQICAAGQVCSTLTTQTGLSGSTYYSTMGQSQGLPVVPGNTFVGNTVAPVACPATGYYWSNGYCNICPAGSACTNSATQNPISCPAGTYAPQTGMSDCMPCPAGYMCTGGGAISICNTGYYSFGYSSSCTQCPEGYYCPSPAQYPLQCAAGMSSTAGSQVCNPSKDWGYPYTNLASLNQPACSAGYYYIPNFQYPIPRCQKCPIGYYCPNIAAKPIPCSSGYHCETEGLTAQTQCGAGYMCYYPHLAQVACPTGYTSSAGSTSCYPNTITCTAGYYAWPNPHTQYICPSGYACPKCYAAPVMCEQGFYSDVGYKFCVQCEAGYKCPSPHISERVACTAGYYSAAGSVNCYPIPNHMYNPSVSTNVRPSWCANGFYNALGNNGVCTQCPAGQQCPGDSITPIACPFGQDVTTALAYKSLAGEMACFPTLVSYASRYYTTLGTGYQNWDQVIPAGYYGQSGMAAGASNLCPLGKQCLFPQDHNWVSCPPGFYDQDNFYGCQPCPEGVVCPNRRTDYQKANNQGSRGGGAPFAGFHSPFGVNIQLVTPAGWYSAQANSYMIRPCPDGTYSNDQAESCTTCPVGFYCPFNSNNPIRCPEGLTSSGTGAYRCVPCPVNQYVNPATNQCAGISAGYYSYAPMMIQEKCRYGDYSDSGTITSSSTQNCKENPGYFMTSGNNNYQQNTCPSGYFCLKNGPLATLYNKIPCPPGYYGNGNTAQAIMTSACNICPAGSYCPGGNQQPITCPAGHFCPTQTWFGTQFPCPFGSYNPNTGQSSTSACTSCPAGSQCYQGASKLFPCPTSSNCPAGGFGASFCASGSYASGGSCVTCPAGYFCPAGVSYAFKCPSGTYTASGGAKSINDCTQCPVGSLCPIYGQTAAATDYTPIAGYLYPKGTAFQLQFPCPAGTYADTTSFSLATSCTACPAGYACPIGTSSATKQTCAPGYYCPVGTQDIRQYPQPSGKYNAAGVSATDCPAGYHCPLGSTKPHPCPVGFYCGGNTVDFRTSPCAAGTYGATQKLTAQSGCTACPAGSYCIVGVITPILCPPGTFSTSGADSADASSGGTKPCTQCTAGSFCPVEGTTAAIPCGTGYFSAPGAQSCFMCQPGQLCNSATISQTTQETATCSGVYCLIAAIYNSGACPQGYYCLAGAFYPIPCPVGTYQAGDQTTSASCISVPAGTYNDEIAQIKAQTDLKLCAPGFKCPIGSISMYQIGCASGTYSSGGAGTCTTCLAGYYCLDVAQFPTPCPPGFYCPAGASQPSMCPIGKFGASSLLSAATQCTICTPGYYCAESGAQFPTGLCNAGYYCPAGQTSPQPSLYPCPAGGYCEVGSSEMTPCRPGYYNPTTGMKTFADCILCTPGSYCAGTIASAFGGKAGTSGFCTAGFYCIAGSVVPNQYPSPPGSYSLTGASSSTLCVAGTYNPLYYQSVCPPCPAGFYCQSPGMSIPTICPVGAFCPISSQSPTLCPIGTYNPVTGGSSQALNCLNCPPGKYCGAQGLSAPSGLCAAGYFCLASAIEISPPALDLISSRWGKCPLGFYCPQGTAYPFRCPIGTYSSLEQLGAITQCTTCTAGSYCETTGLTAPTGLCEAGYYCPTGQTTSRPEAYKCTPGNECVAGTTDAQFNSHSTYCQGGQYQHQSRQSACIDCPVGYFCVTGAVAPIICSAGHFCDVLTSANGGNPCPQGTYQPDTGRQFCLKCPAGYYCATTGLAAPTGQCAAGSFCKVASTSAAPTTTVQGGDCPIGSYCPVGSGFPIPCPPGLACPSVKMSAGVNCQAGYYCIVGTKKTMPTLSQDGGAICPAGYYCPTGSSSPTPCLPGYYQPFTGKTAITDCLDCPPGKYCEDYASTATQQCDDGWYCDTHETSRRPIDSTTLVPKICPIGFYCTQGAKTACPSSKYQDQIGQTSCNSCPAGYQCSTTAITECGQFNYCEFGQATPIICPLGKYSLKVTSSSLTDCTMCPAGYICYCGVACTAVNTPVGCDAYCGASATALPKFDVCPEGYYCQSGTYSTLLPTDAGYPSTWVTGYMRKCTAGSYCPAGTPFEIPCPPGYACVNDGNKFSTIAQCTAGYYCTGGSSSLTQNQCQPGYYCPLGSPAPIPCDVNYYNPTTGSSAVAECVACPLGKTCYNRGMGTPVEANFVCAAGYYCPTALQKLPCDPGYYCPSGSSTQTVCPAGQYTATTTRASCDKCPPGYYCGLGDYTEATYTTTNPITMLTAAVWSIGVPSQALPCPQGMYCPQKTYKMGFKCPVGTYMPYTGATMISDCIPCVEGYQCLVEAKITSTDVPCDAGYYCPSGAISKTKIACPAGSYCPAGVATFINCPVGTVQDAVGKTALTDCSPCPQHYYCPYRGMTSSQKILCGSGFQCAAGSMSPQPSAAQSGSLCPAGYFCSSQILDKTQCAVGFYQPNTGSSECIFCPAGQFCDVIGLTAPNTCTAGNYCPAQSSIVTNAQVKCPAGTYQPIDNQNSLSDCVPCPPGKYCTIGSVTPTGDCAETFFCPGGASVASGYTNTYVFGLSLSGLCPEGHTCAAGTIAPTPCPFGTYNPSVGQKTCLPCPPGLFCDELGMSQDTFDLNDKECYAGYYCPDLRTDSNADGKVTSTDSKAALGNTVPNAVICPPGHYCVKGSATPTICDDGYYEPREGSDACQECPAGFYCPVALVIDPFTNIASDPSITPIICVTGFCEAGVGAPALCPDGTFSNSTLLQMASAEECLVCPLGQYCKQGVLQGLCDAGYFCDFGAKDFRDISKICPQGFYCHAGTNMPTRCPNTLYWGGVGATDISFCGPCPAGYYCVKNDPIIRMCPSGHFCPNQTVEPIPCQAGTYNPWKRSLDVNSCIDCPVGSSCNERGIEDFTKYPCPKGNFCPILGQITPPTPCPAGSYRNTTGAGNKSECWVCPVGYFCLEGSVFPKPCDSGYTCPLGSPKPSACPPGTYCPAMTDLPLPCPLGFFCPAFRTDLYTKCGNGTYCGVGQSKETTCPAGYFGTSVTWNYNVSVSCVACGPGEYSDQGTNQCKPCQAGYLCYGNAMTATPATLNQGGEPCPAGSYCPTGSYVAVACPVGTYSDQKGNGQLNLCLPCPANTFGIDVGQTKCAPCKGSTVSEVGSSTCSCVGLNRRYLTSLGQCVCVSGFTPTDGTDANKDGFSDCQQIIYNLCNKDQVRDISGKCVNTTDCASQCDGGNGTVVQNYGVCQCQNTVTLDQICNADCRANALLTTFSSNGSALIYDPVTNKTVSAPLQNTIGAATCSNPDPTMCQLIPVGMSSSSSGSFTAGYGLPPVLSNQPQVNKTATAALIRMQGATFKGERLFALPNTTQADGIAAFTSGRSLQTTTTPTAQYISNPVVCTTLGSALLWDNLSNVSYPVYQADSLLNSVPDFDYSQFAALPKLLANKTSQNFVFTFQFSGVYVFADSRNPAKIMVVSVMEDKQKCPADSKFSPLTYASLLKVGAQRKDVLTPPDWIFFFCTLAGFVVLIILAVLLVSYIARRNWKQSKAPVIPYQKSNYTQVGRSDPEDQRSIVSINTDSSSFMFRATAGGDTGNDLGQKLADRMMHKQDTAENKKQKQRKRNNTDLSLNQVEALKNSLQKHLKEIRKLNTVNNGKDGKQIDDNFDDDGDSETSSDEEELNRQIAAVKKMIQRASAVLRGEDDNDWNDSVQIDTLPQEKDSSDKARERELALAARRKQLETQHLEGEEKYKSKMRTEGESAVADLQMMKDKVLEQQVESAFDRGKAFQERLERDGAQKAELTDMMDQLEGKMQRVEDLLVDDKQRQADMLKRNLEQRRLRRKKLNEKLVEVDVQIQKNDYEVADKKEEIVLTIQEEYNDEIASLEREDNRLKQELEKKFDQMKLEKLADYQDRLKNAGGTKDFQNILEEFQRAQMLVDRDLQRQRDKETDKLDRDLKARKAKAKAQAEIKRNQRFKQLQEEEDEKMRNQTDNRAKIQESLSVDQKKDEIMDVFTQRLKHDLDLDTELASEMEGKRREEEALRLQHERQQRKLQGEAMKEAQVIDQDINEEIRRLANVNEFEPFQALVNERSQLQKKVAEASTEEEKQLLLRQLKEVDEQVKNQLNAEVKDQDAALKRRLEARKHKRNVAIEKERNLKQGLLQQRITFALDNSTEFAVTKNNFTLEALDSIINQMKLELTPEEIPAALERIVDDKHQKELQDWLLKLYEQKAIELKEEILALLEEKVGKQQVLRKNFEDRSRGIDAIISRSTDPAVSKELQIRKSNLQNELNSEINRLEQDFTVSEQKKTREIQARCMQRESKALFDMSEMQFEEKKKIFETFLPDSLMKEIYEELGKREKEDLARYRQELDVEAQKKIKQMEEEDRIIQAELLAKQEAVKKLSIDEQKLIQKEIYEQRRQQKVQREKQAVVSSQDVIQKIRTDLEKGLEEFSGAYEDEHKRQLAIIEAKMRNRSQAKKQYEEQKQIEMKRQQEEAQVAKMQEEDRIRMMRSKKQMLLSTITQGQKVILKGCYSRPIWHFNSKIHDATVKNDDLAQTLIAQQEQFQSQVVKTLLQRIQDLEEKTKAKMADTKSTNKGRRRSSATNRLKGLAALRAAIDETTSQLSRKNSNTSSRQ